MSTGDCPSDLVSGFKFSRASYLLSLLRPQIYTDLELKVVPRSPRGGGVSVLFHAGEGPLQGDDDPLHLRSLFCLRPCLAHRVSLVLSYWWVLSSPPSILKIGKFYVKIRLILVDELCPHEARAPPCSAV